MVGFGEEREGWVWCGKGRLGLVRRGMVDFDQVREEFAWLGEVGLGLDRRRKV